MNKRNLYLAIGVLLGISILFNTIQFAVSYFKNKEIKTLTSQVSLREKTVIELSDSNSTLESDVLQLSEENGVLKEKIKALNKKIRRLSSKVRKSSDKIVSIQKAISFLKKREAELVEQVNFGASRMADQLSGQEVMKEQERLQGKIIFLENKNDSLKQIKDTLYEEIAEKEGERMIFMRKEAFTQDIFDIIQYVEVEFFEIQPRKQNKKKARSAKKWYDTVLNLSLTYKDQRTLEGRDFLVRIINTSTQKVIAPQEHNKRDKEGVIFTFESNPIATINYTNYQKKEKGNYAIQVFLLKNKEEYLLNKGTIAIDF
mgnify:CR=1 FL=1